MVDYENILLATDFSEHSEAAGRRAMDIAQRYKARLTLFHVVEVDAPQVIPIEWAEAMKNEGLESYWTFEARKKMAEFAKRINARDADQVVISGMFSPKKDILKYCKEQDVDLIIMGSHGKQGIDVLLGSTVSGVMHKSICDVLIVRI